MNKAKVLLSFCIGVVLLWLFGIQLYNGEPWVTQIQLRVEQLESKVEELEREIDQLEAEAVHSGHRVSSYVSQCKVKHVTVTERECRSYETHELADERTFPMHHVSGVPGSGNDWILWLGSLTRYSWSKYKNSKTCEVYRKQEIVVSKQKTCDCLFLKSHEPWFWEPNSTDPEKAVLLLRHPYDAAFAEYKRRLAVKEQNGKSFEAVKTTTLGQNAEAFIDVQTNSTAKEWKSTLISYARKWVKHATHWLTKYQKPVHVMIYNRIRNNTVEEIEKMQAFLDYKFDGANFRRHCCLRKNTLNKSLKRSDSIINKYRNYAWEQEPGIQSSYRRAVEAVHTMLDQKFPDHKYRVERG